MSAFVIALLGAESTGKTQLAAALGQTLSDSGKKAAVVNEYLREFCDQHGRTPSQAEQTHIADEQTRRIDQMAPHFEVVIADTTALMTAVYSDKVFGDRSLYTQALLSHRRVNLTLVTALDIAWEPDGLQRDGPEVREPVDAMIRAALRQAGLDYSVVTGQGAKRQHSALRCIEHAMRLNLQTREEENDGLVRWRGLCERCGDAACERLCFPR
ncbi:MAG: AAA family ATPase [Burkholderiaceae bacterium]